MPNLSLVLLFALVILLALYWTWTGLVGAVLFHQSSDQDWWGTLRGLKWLKSWLVMSNTRIGLSMLKTIGGGILFVLMAAGLKF